jgi:Rrf2 family transcriptional regulator, iron-sulfur cluster assembly transcription factor
VIYPSEKLLSLIESLLYIAHHEGDLPIRGTQLSEILNISTRYLEPVLQILVHEGILKSTRGPQGGYSFLKDPKDVRLSDVAIPVFEKSTRTERQPVSTLSANMVMPFFNEAYHAYIKTLESITIDSLFKRAKEAGLLHAAEKKNVERMDFII